MLAPTGSKNIIAGSRTLPELKTRLATSNKAEADAKKAADVVESFDTLESTFTRSQGTSADLAPKDKSKVLLDSQHALPWTKRAANFLALGLVTSPYLMGTGLGGLLASQSSMDGKLTGIATFGKDGKADFMDAELKPAHGGPQQHFSKTVSDDGTTTYSVTMPGVLGRGGSRQVVQEKDGVLTLMEDSSTMGNLLYGLGSPGPRLGAFGSPDGKPGVAPPLGARGNNTIFETNNVEAKTTGGPPPK